MKKLTFKIIFFLSLFVLAIVTVSNAQVPPPGGSNLPPDGIPIDGGLGILLAGLIAYSYKKYLKKGKIF